MNRHTQRMNTEGVSILEMLRYLIRIQEHKRVKKDRNPRLRKYLGFFNSEYWATGCSADCKSAALRHWGFESLYSDKRLIRNNNKYVSCVVGYIHFGQSLFGNLERQVISGVSIARPITLALGARNGSSNLPSLTKVSKNWRLFWIPQSSDHSVNWLILNVSIIKR